MPVKWGKIIHGHINWWINNASRDTDADTTLAKGVASFWLSFYMQACGLASFWHCFFLLRLGARYYSAEYSYTLDLLPSINIRYELNLLKKMNLLPFAMVGRHRACTALFKRSYSAWQSLSHLMSWWHDPPDFVSIMQKSHVSTGSKSCWLIVVLHILFMGHATSWRHALDMPNKIPCAKLTRLACVYLIRV